MTRPRLTAKVAAALRDAAMVCRATAESMDGEEDERERFDNLHLAAEWLERLCRWHKGRKG